MFDHVTIRVSDLAASERFYATVLAPLGVAAELVGGGEFVEWGRFSLALADADNPVTRGLHVAFSASSRERVDAFWQAGVDAGYRDDGAPGARPQYSDDYHGAFLLDPDGNSAEAVTHGRARDEGEIDHLWIRVADVEAATRFYALVAPHAGFELRGRLADPERTQFGSPTGSFSVVAGPPTEHVHVAFPAPRATVDEFHRALVGAGYRDNGAPGERPRYDAGYYGAFVLDPDGNNVELVDHHG